MDTTGAVSRNFHPSSGSDSHAQANISLPPPDPSLDEENTDWCTLHSLDSLKLTLDCVLHDCMIPNQPPLFEFPLKTEVNQPPLMKLESPLKTLPPRARLSGDQLALKRSQLDLAIQLYRDHINELQQGSRAIFGSVRGDRLCVLIDTSDLHVFGARRDEDDQCRDEDREDERQEFVECRHNLRQLCEEQLSQKSKVYLLQLGNEDFEKTPTALNFREHKQRCMMISGEWLNSLRGSGSCSLLGGLEKALALPDLDTILIVLGSRPNEDIRTVVGFVRDRLAGARGPHIHWMAHQCNNKEMLYQLARDTGAQFHSYGKSGGTEMQVEDTDISTLTAQLKEAESVISELEKIQSGHLSSTVLSILTQLNMTKSSLREHCTTDIADDEHMPVSSKVWLTQHSVNASGLNIYSMLAPNAYSQLKAKVVHSPDTHAIIPSVVYDEMMTQFTWYDGSLKYLHIDVHLIEGYQARMEDYITMVQQRLNWLTSGSRAPFGVISEKSVVLLVECSAATLPFISQLQSNLYLLLSEQLTHVEQFNIMRIGEDSAWQCGLTQQTKDTLNDAWVWLLRQSPAGTTCLMPSLEMVLSGDTYTYSRERDVGVYLVISSMPKDNMERICSFLREKMAQTNMHVHVVYYQQTPPTINHAIAALSFEEGCYPNDQELTHCLQQIANAGSGRFHSFKGPSTVRSDDIDTLLEELEKAQNHLRMASKILEDYRHFCKRSVPLPPLPPSPPPPSDPPPLYPRPNTAFLTRMNATSTRIARSASDSQLSRRQTKSHHHTRRTKTLTFYLDTGLEKGVTLERATHDQTKRILKNTLTTKSLSVTEWLSKHGLESLGLNFSQFEVQKRQQRRQKMTYKHINNKGEVVELYINHDGLKRYALRIKRAKDSYLAKLDELSKGWCQFFGRVTESKVLFLIDISCSMAGSFEELRAALIDFIKNRPHTLKYFNMVTYCSSVRRWKEACVPCTNENVEAAVQWVSLLTPGGCSCLLHALKVSLALGVNYLYLITDGTADHTHEFLLSQVHQLRAWYGDTWKINTVAFHCTIESSYKFMKQMAHRTGGRYHSCPWATDTCRSHPAHLLQNGFLGEDVEKLVQEIISADDYLLKASCYL